MSDERKYYCYCDSNCKYETMTREQILAAIAQAMETGVVVDPNAGFITKVKETNVGDAVTFWVGTRAQYNAITSPAKNCLYIITDDAKSVDIDATVARMQNDIAALTAFVVNCAPIGLVTVKRQTVDGWDDLQDLVESALLGMEVGDVKMVDVRMFTFISYSGGCVTIYKGATDEGYTAADVEISTAGTRVHRYGYMDGESWYWYPWEWENPPMEVGVEYCTTEKYRGRRVFKMLLHFNALAVAGGSVEQRVIPLDSDDNGKIICMEGYAFQKDSTGDTGGIRHPFPVIPYSTDNSIYARLQSNGTKVIIHSLSDAKNDDGTAMTKYAADVVVKYYKFGV